MSTKNLLMFTAGAITGSVSTWYFIKSKYQQLAQEEIDSVKEVFSDRHQDIDANSVSETSSQNEETVTESSTVSNQSVSEKPAITDYVRTLQEHNYAAYSESREENDTMTDDQKTPYIIPPNEFGENEEFDTISLTYYLDGILTDENEEVIENVDDLIGADSLNHFGEFEDDSVFVRNEKNKCDYEILLDQREYSDVLKTIPQ